VSCAVDTLSAVFDVETHSAQLEDSRTVLRDSKGENFRQSHPGAMSVNQQAKERGTLGLSLHQPCTGEIKSRAFQDVRMTSRFGIGDSRLTVETIGSMVQRNRVPPALPALSFPRR